MKKTLGISSLLEKEVPRHLDNGILAYAAIANRRRTRKQFVLRIAGGIAAAFCLAAGVSVYMIRQPEAPRQLSNAELLALTDFTVLEQESYAIGAMTSSDEINFDNYI